MKNATIILTAIVIMACNEVAPADSLTCDQVRAELVEAETSEMRVWDDYEDCMASKPEPASTLQFENEAIRRELQSTYVEIDRIAEKCHTAAVAENEAYEGLHERATDLLDAMWTIDRDIVRFNCENGNIEPWICDTMNIHGNGE